MAREYDHLFKLLIIGDSGKTPLLWLMCGCPGHPRVKSLGGGVRCLVAVGNLITVEGAVFTHRES